jgi:hypothetical protein
MEKNQINPDVIIYGAGAIGASICGRLTPIYRNIYLIARGQNAQVIKSKIIADSLLSDLVPSKIKAFISTFFKSQVYFLLTWILM